MKWFLGTYTMRFNRRHHYSGHLFGGRYKAQVIDETTPGYLRTAADYVHLNPARAGLVTEDEKLASYPWSSYPAYLAPAGKRPAWLRVDRVLGEHGIEQDDRRGRREFKRRLENQRQTQLAAGWEMMRNRWRVGAEDFLDRLLGKWEGKMSEHHGGREGSETEIEKARRLIASELARAGWGVGQLARERKGAAVTGGNNHAAQVDRRRTAYGHVDAPQPSSAHATMSVSLGLTPDDPAVKSAQAPPALSPSRVCPSMSPPARSAPFAGSLRV